MSVLEILSVFLAGLITLAGLSLLLNPQSQTSSVVTSFGDAIANDIKAAKAF